MGLLPSGDAGPRDPIHLAVHAGDGVGPTVTDAALAVLDAVLGPGSLDVRRFDGGPSLLDAEGVVLRDADLETLRTGGFDAVLFGATATRPGDPSLVVALRSGLGLFANVRPVRDATGRVDLVVYRELAEGLYAGPPVEEGADRVVDAKVATREGVDRFLAFVRDHLARTGRRRVTLLHKANVLASDRLWLDRFRAAFPDGDDALLDSALYRLAQDPAAFDAVVCENLYGDLVSDLAAVHATSLGLLPSASYGPPGTPPLYEPVHGAALDIAGQGVANPAGAILSAALLLDDQGRPAEAAAVRDATWRTVRDRPTPDLGGTATTEAFTDHVLALLGAEARAGSTEVPA